MQSCFIISLLLYVTAGCHHMGGQCHIYNNISHKYILYLGMFEWLYMYCFHMIKQYSSYKITIFPSFINTLYWKSLVYHGFYLKSFLPPNTQKSLKALIFSTFLSSPVLSCGKQAFCFYNMIKQYFSDKTYHYKFFRALSLLSVVLERQFL